MWKIFKFAAAPQEKKKSPPLISVSLQNFNNFLAPPINFFKKIFIPPHSKSRGGTENKA